ncbi:MULTISPECIES: hypothetical protein [Oscillospiraceae]|uniref:Uncharacterized protein n=1 Tax=Pseudobacteroides cellulosolvens ATCC 35603 = DSM 2933 TaxID=398512 RepID=A0A0L6JTC9_9FIRM|nr:MULTISPECIES: hypothetical protein [Oscillospiraceae]KNY29106.1 hypothetical protein Bccel_4380 [Pseudobacteroides cellulosolvens ATCC 35603 = DSM 2933]
MTSQFEVDKWIDELKKDAKFKSLWEYSEKYDSPQIEKIRRKHIKKKWIIGSSLNKCYFLTIATDLAGFGHLDLANFNHLYSKIYIYYREALV